MNILLKSILTPETFELIGAALEAARKVLGNDLDGLEDYFVSRIGADPSELLQAEIYSLTADALISGINQYNVVCCDDIINATHIYGLTCILNALVDSQEPEVAEYVVRVAQTDTGSIGFLIGLTEALGCKDEIILWDLLDSVPDSFVTAAVKVAETNEDAKATLAKLEEVFVLPNVNKTAISGLINSITSDNPIKDYFLSNGVMGHSVAAYVTVFGGELGEIADIKEAASCMLLIGLYAGIAPNLIPAIVGKYAEVIFVDTETLMAIQRNIKIIGDTLNG